MGHCGLEAHAMCELDAQLNVSVVQKQKPQEMRTDETHGAVYNQAGALCASCHLFLNYV